MSSTTAPHNTALHDDGHNGSASTTEARADVCSSAANVPAGDVRDLLLRITRDLVGAQDLSEMLQTMVDAARQIVPAASRCVIHLLDATGTRLTVGVCSPPSPTPPVQQTGFPRDVGIAGRALRERRAINVTDTTTSSDYVPLRSGGDLRSLLVAPLYVRESDLGTLSLSSPQPGAFTTEHVQNVETLAAQASVAIHQGNLLRAAIAERERSDAIIESMADGVVILDGQQNVVRLNPAIQHKLGLAEKLPPTLDATKGYTPAPTLRVLLDPSAGRVVGSYDVELELPSRDRLTLRVLPSALSDPEGASVRVVHDITIEREASRERALFTSQVSHELRTPLQHILGFTSLLRDMPNLSSDDSDRFFAHIEDETRHMARLVDDLMELSRIEAGRFAVHAEPLALGDLIAGTLQKVQPRADQAKVKLSFQAPDQPIHVLADAMRVHQILTNLVENALKFTPREGQICVSLERTSRWAALRVADTGPGIPPQELPRLFDRFYQGGSGRRRRTGMGLGLYISCEIARAMGGDIGVESVVGSGTTFTLTLPYWNPEATTPEKEEQE